MKNTNAAMRAANAILDRIEGRAGRITSDELRDIIDRTTGLPDLLEAAKLTNSFISCLPGTPVDGMLGVAIDVVEGREE